MGVPTLAGGYPPWPGYPHRCKHKSLTLDTNVDVIQKKRLREVSTTESPWKVKLLNAVLVFCICERSKGPLRITVLSLCIREVSLRHCSSGVTTIRTQEHRAKHVILCLGKESTQTSSCIFDLTDKNNSRLPRTDSFP